MKQPDCCFIPLETRSLGDFPTLVVETGFSQSSPALNKAMSWWFENPIPDHSLRDVRIGVLFLFSSSSTQKEVHAQRRCRNDKRYPTQNIVVVEESAPQPRGYNDDDDREPSLTNGS
ncbi:hypothetical protein QBC38DRAFT_252513 [Podospora fimiseda]|uniref:Uncharacterized protein n=1 Tax=Podospora fimiseda TaxID=252190 RepID=A0AAN7BM37_9PEZI|nr:hypothetical protein QBC38DRAFT_252513 [Podospora fimiseda]